MALTQAERLHKTFHNLLREKFRSGFDPGSIIDRKKLHHLLRLQGTQESFEPDEAMLREEATRSCLEWEGKFYAIDQDAWAYLKEIMAGLREEGTNLVNVDVFFQKFGPQFVKLGLVSPGLFQEFLRSKLGKLPNYLRLNSKEELASEFIRKLEDLNYIPQKRLAELFPFLTTEDVARWAGKFLHYAALRNGDLYLPAALVIDENEWQRELAKIKRDIAKQGYFFFSQLDLSKSRDNYPDLPEAAFTATLEKKLGEAGLKISGPAIVAIDKPINLFELVQDYCKTLKNFTFETLKLEFGADINKLRFLIDAIKRVSFQIDSDRFVSIDSIELNVQEVDQLLLDANRNGFFPITSYPYFHLLPSIAPYSWNAYALQSYIMHLSNRFGLTYPSLNNLCIGIIYDKGKIKNPDYYQLAARAALADNIAPNPAVLSIYLKQKGFFCRARTSAINSVIKNMSALA